MKVFVTATLMAVGVALFSAGTASAQITSPFARPNWRPGYRTQLSPYLNLLRGGNTATNYYLGVLPEQQRRQFNVQFGADIRSLEENQNRLDQAPLDQRLFDKKIQSGHATASGTTLNYFGNSAGYYPIPQLNPVALPTTPRRTNRIR